MKRRVLSLLIAMCMVFSLFPAAAATEPHAHLTEKAPEPEQSAAPESQEAPIVPLDTTEVPALVFGEEQVIACTSTEYTNITFTPETSGRYHFYSTGTRDTKAELYDSEGGYLGYNDDCRDTAHEHESSLNFCIVAQLEAGVTYTLKVMLYGGDPADVTVGVICGHTYNIDIDQDAGTISFECTMCGKSFDETCTELAFCAETAIPCQDRNVSYATFTAEFSGLHYFYSVDDASTNSVLYDMEMNFLTDERYCSDESHNHPEMKTYCIGYELEAGTTYLLGVNFNGDVGARDMTVRVSCGHNYSGILDIESGVMTFTCSMCGDEYTETYPVLEYGVDQTITTDENGDTTVLFTPATSGSYRFYNAGEIDTAATLYDLDMNEIAWSSYCLTESHGHPVHDSHCITEELEAGVTYILEIQTDSYEAVEVTIGVGCAHEFTYELDQEAGTVDLVCKLCGYRFTEACTTLTMGEAVNSTTTAEDRYVYFSFTAQGEGSYLFHLDSEVNTFAYLYTLSKDYRGSGSTCTETEHGFQCDCMDGYLNAGQTYILQISPSTSAGGPFTIGVSCRHNYEQAFPQEVGVATFVCVTCGDSYTEECPVLEYNKEVTVTLERDAERYFTFTPETTGSYRFTSLGSYVIEAELSDMEGTRIASSGYCLEEDHMHENRGCLCITAELEGGQTYVLSANLDYDNWEQQEEVTIVVGCDHVYLSEIIEVGTCGEPGIIHHTCQLCGTVTVAEYKVSHSYTSEVIQEANCEVDGIERHTCTVCGYSYESEIWGRHNYVEERIPGSCTEYTMYVRTCTKCGDSYSYEGWYVHDYQDVITQAPTCTEKGYYIEQCTLCGESDGPWSMDALGHDYNEDQICTNCGQAFPTSGAWEHMNYTLIDGVLTITGEGEMPEILIIDAYYTEYIDNTPWKDFPVREVIIGEGITNVTTALFLDREELEKVTLPSTLKRIENLAFSDASVSAVNLPEGLTYIGSDAFWGCDLTEIDLPESLTYLGHYAFGGCDLRQVHIPAALLDPYSDYGYYEPCDWFAGNENLTSITVDGNNPRLCSDAQGALYNKDMTELLLVPYGIEGTYVLPASVTEIHFSFSDCAKLDTIEVEEGSADYFSRNGMLYTDGFYTSYEDHNENIIFTRYDSILISCPPAKKLGSYTIDAETSAISDYAFVNCLDLTELTIPVTCTVNPYGYDGWWSFGDAVSGCSNLEAVWFEEGHRECSSDENGFVYNAEYWYDGMTMCTCEPGELLAYVPAAYPHEYLEIPEGVTFVDARIEVPGLKAIRFPTTLEGLGSYVLPDSNVEWILFTGEQPEVSFMGDPWATNLHADLYYPGWMDSWGSELDEDSTFVNYIPYEQGKAPVWSNGEPENPFTDVPEDSFYAEPVAWAVERGITTGASADSFNPDGQCLRAQVVTFLWRAEGCPEPKSLNNPFVDVKETDFYFKAVLWAVEKGITNGSDATHFNPFGVCNRAQVVTFLHRAKGSPAPESMDLPFTDVPAGTWYTAPIAWAVENSITNGLSATAFGPDAACNRAQVVTFLYRAYNN